MPRPGSPLHVFSFDGENDDVPMTIGQTQASVLENWTKKRKTLVRRRGQSLLATASLSIDPLTLSPVLYLRSDQVTGTDGSAVATWNDISGNAFHATQGTANMKPILRLTGSDISPNGTRMIDFVDSNDNMQGTLPFGPGIDITNGITIYIYCKELSTTAGGAFSSQEIFSVANSVSAFEILTRTSTLLGVGLPDQEYGTNSGNVWDSYGATVLGYQTLTAVFYPPASATAQFKLFKNGTQLGSTQTNWQAIDLRTGYTVGNGGSQNIAFRGTIGTVIVFAEAHDETTRLGVEDFITDFFEA